MCTRRQAALTQEPVQCTAPLVLVWPAMRPVSPEAATATATATAFDTRTPGGGDQPALSASTKRPAVRPACAHCALPLPACLCRFIRPTTNQCPLLVLQHPLEAQQAKGSARLLRLSLACCQLQVSEHFDDELLAHWLTPAPGEAQSLLLYPDTPDRAAPASMPIPIPMGPQAAPRRLVLLDGTWRQARRLLQRNPQLAALPRWALPTPPPSRYTIRKAHLPQQRSTLEAACLALATLEGEAAVYAPLLEAFDAWVASLAARAAAGRQRSLTSA